MKVNELRQLIREEVKKLRASKGKKQSLQESFSWQRQPGKPLPTLSDVREAYQKKKKLKEDSWGNEEDYGTKDLDSSKGGTDNSLNKVHSNLVKVQKQMDKLLADFKAGTITRDNYIAKRKPLQRSESVV